MSLFHTFTYTGATQSQVWYYKANSCYDPCIDGHTTQPNGFDQMVTLYLRYRVLSTDYKWLVSNAHTEAILVQSYPSTAALFTDTNHGFAQAGAKEMILNIPAGGPAVGTMYQKMNHSRVFGKKLDQDHSAFYNADPTSMDYMGLRIANIGTANIAADGVKAWVKITQFVEWFDPKPNVDA